MRTLLLLPLMVVTIQDDEDEGLEGLGVQDPTRAAREAAELALEDGRLEDASRHVRRALEGAPFDEDLLLLALRSVGDDADAASGATKRSKAAGGASAGFASRGTLGTYHPVAE